MLKTTTRFRLGQRVQIKNVDRIPSHLRGQQGVITRIGGNHVRVLLQSEIDTTTDPVRVVTAFFRDLEAER